MKIKAPDEAYVQAANNLNEEQKERLLSRMRGKLTRKWENEKLDTLHALAIQLEIEDAELADWREKMNEITEKEKEDETIIKSEEKEEKITNFLFGIMIIFTFLGTAFIYKELNVFTQDIKDKNPEYKFPCVKDMYISLIAASILIVSLIIFINFFYYIFEKI